MAAFDMDPIVAVALDLVGAEPAAVTGAISLVGHHPLREQPIERLGKAQLSEPLQRAGPEARVEQVQDRMLDPADILPDRQPFLGLRSIERSVLGLAREADEIPR